jgi:two-component system, LytTR family, sensor kinase
MQSLATVNASTIKHETLPEQEKGLYFFLHQRILGGFKVGELLVWLTFHLSWPLILAAIYTVTGKFGSPNFMPLSRFLSIQGFVIAGKAIFLLPFWWLYFVKMRNTVTCKKVPLHVITSAVYIACCIGFFTLALREVLGVNYSRNDRINDIYHLLLTYLLHFAIFHAYNFWLHTQRQIKKEQELRELAYKSEIQALKSQIEPHFLFNTLNSISASVPPSLETTRVLIAQLADTFRYALRANESQFVSLGDELEFTKTWLALEKQRFGKRLTINCEIDKNALSVMVPPMLLQPLVENALNHGIADKVEGGTVTMQCLVRDNNTVHIAISDTGVGYRGNLEQMFTAGVGLSNTAKRLKLIYNETLVAQRQEQGLRFSFNLPMKPLNETKRIDN